MRAVGVIASAHVDTAAAGYVLVNDDCENFTDAPWTTNGSVTVVASHTGNGFQFASGSTVRADYNIATIDQRDSLTVGMHLRLATLTGTQDVFQFRSDTGATQHVMLRPSTNGSLTVLRSPSTQLGSAAPVSTIVVNTWYYVEMAVMLHDLVGSVVVRVNGTPVITATNVDTRNAGTKSVFDQFRLNSIGAVSPWQVDNVYIRNDLTFGP